MTREERIKYAKQIVAAAEKRGAEIGPGCIGCRFARDVNYSSIGRCRNPVSALQRGREVNSRIEYMKPQDARAVLGFCGPEALFFKRRTWHQLAFWAQPTMNRQAMWLIADLVLFLTLLTVIGG